MLTSRAARGYWSYKSYVLIFSLQNKHPSVALTWVHCCLFRALYRATVRAVTGNASELVSSCAAGFDWSATVWDLKAQDLTGYSRKEMASTWSHLSVHGCFCFGYNCLVSHVTENYFLRELQLRIFKPSRWLMCRDSQKASAPFPPVLRFSGLFFHLPFTLLLTKQLLILFW